MAPGFNPLRRLPELGQSVWYDYIRRDLMESGTLARFIERDDLRGMTTNPAIFAAAVAQGELYDSVLADAGPQATPEQAYERIAVLDVQRAADEFLPVWQRTEGLDGYVSIEVAPALAFDAEGTIADARRLWRLVDRPNAMVKIPGTFAGLAAVTACLAEGMNINVTLLFSIERYRQVMDAYMSALEMRLESGLELRSVSSVASFFVSRVDSLVDARLDAMDAPAHVRGKAGVANAQLAYEAFVEEMLTSQRFARLAAHGARLQRPLWASTSAKNPAYPDTLYVDRLIGPHTVNTVPPETYDAYLDHGSPAESVQEDLDGARGVFARLRSLGIDMDGVTARLEAEGVEKFQAAFDSLLETVRSRQAALFGA